MYVHDFKIASRFGVGEISVSGSNDGKGFSVMSEIASVGIGVLAGSVISSVGVGVPAGSLTGEKVGVGTEVMVVTGVSEPEVEFAGF